MVFWFWQTNKKWCSQSLDDSWATDNFIINCVSLSLPYKSTSSIFFNAIKVLGNGIRLFDFFIGFQKQAVIEKLLGRVPPTLVMVLIIGVMYLPMSLATLSTITIVALSGVLFAALKQGTAAYTILTNPKIVYIGLISYSLYLWHWGILSISRWTIGIHWWSAPFQIALIIGLAIASYKWIETPLRKRKWSGKRWKTLGIGGGILIISSAGVITSRIIQVSPLLEVYIAKNNKHGGLIKTRKLYREMSRPARIYPELMEECLERSKEINNNRVGYLIGDSHARNYLIAARKALPMIDIKYMTMGYDCAFLPSPMVSKKLDKITSCNQYVKRVRSLIEQESKPGDIVFIGQALRGQEHDLRAVPQYFDHIKSFAQTLSSKSIPVIIFDGTFPPGHPELCKKEIWRPYPNKLNCEKKIEEVYTSYKKFDQMAIKTTNSAENIYYIPLRFGLCTDKYVGNIQSKELYLA